MTRTLRRSYFHAALALGAAFATLHATAQTINDPRGRWITASGNLEVEVAPCGSALCGTVTRVLGNRSMSRDGEAMKPADDRPALGMTLLRDFVPDIPADEGAAPTAWSGEIYNRENGKTYRCDMTMGDTGELVLRAYVGLPIFGKTQRWQRASAAPAAAALRQ